MQGGPPGRGTGEAAIRTNPGVLGLERGGTDMEGNNQKRDKNRFYLVNRKKNKTGKRRIEGKSSLRPGKVL